MIRKFNIAFFFSFALVIFGGLFWLGLSLAGWSQQSACWLTALLLVILISITRDYYQRIFQDDPRVRAKQPPSARSACLKIAAVLAIAMFASWIGYALTALALSHNPLFRLFASHEVHDSSLLLHDLNRPRILSPDLPSVLLSRYPPECPGICGWARYGVGLFSAILALCLASRKFIPARIVPSTKPYYRGRKLLTLVEARTAADAILPQGDAGIPWGGVRLPTAATTTHVLLLGASGSGKTLSLRMILQIAFAKIGFGQDRRALVLDGKRELLTYLHNMRLRCPVKILNPFDARGAAWDIAQDCTDPATAWEIAVILMPSRGETQMYFVNAAQDLLSGVFIAFHLHCPGKWTFRDVVLVLENPEMLRKLLQLHPETRNRLNYFTKDATFLDILTTISTRIAPYRQIAAAWSHATEKISLREWITGALILVLAADETVRSSLDAINQAIFKRATELVLAQDESADRETWFILDELREAGKLEGITSLLTKGRSFGARVVAGFQDIEGIRAVYGDKQANEIAGLCSHKAVFRLDDAETAQWASKILGEFEYYEGQVSTTTSTTADQTTKSTTTTNQLMKRQVVMPEQFLGLPTTDRSNGLAGYYISPLLGGFFSTLTPDYLDHNLLPANPSEPNFIPRPKEQQYLKPWTAADLRRLNLEGFNDPPTPSPDTSATNSPQPPKSPPPKADLKSVRRVERPRGE